MAQQKKIVWEFTNQRKLGKSEFVDYFERKIFRTIRKYGMLPSDRKVVLPRDDLVNTKVLEKVLSKKFSVEFSSKFNFSSNNLSDVAEKIFENILKGKFVGVLPKEKGVCYPLYFLNDKEVLLYASLVGVKGKKSKRNKRVQDLFEKFVSKNPDLEHNVVNAFGQLGE